VPIPYKNGQELEKAMAAARIDARNAALKTLSAHARKVCTEHPTWELDVCIAISNKNVHIGMTTEQVKAAWGRPETLNRTVSSGTVSEQWVYGSTYLYIENGVMTSYQDSR
jgi:hypothetical protein